MFEVLRKEYLQEREEQKNKNRFFIRFGYMESWSDEHKEQNDNGLKRYLTDLRFEQYTSGKIDREKAVELAIKRMEKQIDKEQEKKIDLLERIAAAPDLNFISVNVEWRRSATWGYNPLATTNTNNGQNTGYASGCGYDKESAAVAEAFNKDLSILKVLYTIKENGLAAGLSDKSKTACTGVDNRTVCGYGAGYGVLPYFEGGVGVGCFWDILKKAGYKTRCNYGKHENFYSIYKETEV